jgi:hypothetical protein
LCEAKQLASVHTQQKLPLHGIQKITEKVDMEEKPKKARIYTQTRELCGEKFLFYFTSLKKFYVLKIFLFNVYNLNIFVTIINPSFV